MNSKDKVLADENGVVINQSANPDYGYIRVEQAKTIIDDNGFLRRKNVSAVVPGLISDLQANGYYAGQEIPGNIMIVESLEPFNKKNPERDYKIAGDTGIICKLEGSPIFRKTVYTLAANAEDVLVKHDNVAELRAAYATQTTSSAMKPSAEFDI
jgi:hypothetical protein